MSNQLQYLNDQELQDLFKDKNDFKAHCIIIDIRNPEEARREHIAGSINIPIDQINEERMKEFENKTLIFHCQVGSRTRNNESKLAMLSASPKLCMSGGIEQWKQLGLETILDKSAPIELNRQVQIIAGSIIIAGALLAYFVSIYWLVLVVFVGVGLVFAGLSGFCGMARLLMLLPYNKPG